MEKEESAKTIASKAADEKANDLTKIFEESKNTINKILEDKGMDDKGEAKEKNEKKEKK